MKTTKIIDNNFVDNKKSKDELLKTKQKPPSRKKKCAIIITTIVWLLLLGGAAGLAILVSPEPEVIHTDAIQEAYKFNQNSKSEVVDLVTDVDYYGFYTPNQIKINITYGDLLSSISGLKDKEVEQKINSYLKANPNAQAKANYYNILSIKIDKGYYKNQKGEYVAGLDSKTFDLSTGNEITFDDLFAEGTNVSSILLTAFSASLKLDYSEKIWQLNHTKDFCEYLAKDYPEEYAKSKDCQDIKTSYSQKLHELEDKLANSEDEAIIKVADYLKGKKKFYLISSGIFFYTDDGFNATFYLRDSIKYAVYLKNYRTETSIYENDNLYSQRLITQDFNPDTIPIFEETDNYTIDLIQNITDCTSKNTNTYSSSSIKFEKDVHDHLKKMFVKQDAPFTYISATAAYCESEDIDIDITEVREMSKDYYNSTFRKAVIEGKNNDAKYLENGHQRTPDESLYDSSKTKAVDTKVYYKIYVGKSGKLYYPENESEIFTDVNEAHRYLKQRANEVLNLKCSWGDECVSQEVRDSSTYSYNLDDSVITVYLTSKNGKKYSATTDRLRDLPEYLLVPDLRP